MRLGSVTGGNMWVVYVIIIMFIVVVTKCCYDSMCNKSSLSSEKVEDLYEEDKEDKEVVKKDKPKISPPVHSMLELMMKDPDGFTETWDSYLEGSTWKHRESSICFTKRENYSYKKEAYESFYYINLCLITEQEGEYLQQGVKYIESRRKREREKASKEYRHQVDRKIRKILEEVV